MDRRNSRTYVSKYARSREPQENRSAVIFTHGSASPKPSLTVYGPFAFHWRGTFKIPRWTFDANGRKTFKEKTK